MNNVSTNLEEMETLLLSLRIVSEKKDGVGHA